MDQLRPFLFLLAGVVFFNCNYSFLPVPLAWTNLFLLALIPVIFSKKNLKIGAALFGLFALFAIGHFSVGVVQEYYIRSATYLFYLSISSVWLYSILKERQEHVRSAFLWSTLLSIALFIVAVILFLFDLNTPFWKAHDFVGKGSVFQRYQGLSYEPSHLALIITPLFIYYFLMVTLHFSTRNLLLFIGLVVLLVSTVSFGFFGAFVFGFVCLIIYLKIKIKQLPKVLKLMFAVGLTLFIVACTVSQGIRERVITIAKVQDTSVRGRTFEAFYLGYKCAEQKSLIFGIGQGQIKVIGEDVIRPFYGVWDPVGYSKENWPNLALPNASAETLAIFGFVGLFLRFAIQFVLFFRCSVYENYFQLLLFLFLFFYQLMGSFISSTAEISLWVLCFLPLFKELKITKAQKL